MSNLIKQLNEATIVSEARLSKKKVAAVLQDMKWFEYAMLHGSERLIELFGNELIVVPKSLSANIDKLPAHIRELLYYFLLELSDVLYYYDDVFVNAGVEVDNVLISKLKEHYGSEWKNIDKKLHTIANEIVADRKNAELYKQLISTLSGDTSSDNDSGLPDALFLALKKLNAPISDDEYADLVHDSLGGDVEPSKYFAKMTKYLKRIGKYE